MVSLLPFIRSNLYDVFINIRDDELEHVKTMAACQDGSVALDLQVRTVAGAGRLHGGSISRSRPFGWRLCAAAADAGVHCTALSCECVAPPHLAQNMQGIAQAKEEQNIAWLAPWSSEDDSDREAEAAAKRLPPGKQ